MTINELYSAIGGDLPDVTRRFGGETRVKKFICRFPNDPTYAEFETAWAAKDEATIFSTTHTLKGVFATFSLTEMRTIASYLTEQYRPENKMTHDPAVEQEKVERLSELYHSTIELINRFKDENT